MAIGKPVAFEASADERETRGFISMTIIRPSFGLTANWTFEPPVSTPISRMIAIDGVAHPLVFLVGQRLRRRDRDRVAGVDAHRVEVLDRADDDEVVRLVAHDLQLELLPADQALLDQELAGRREVEAALADLLELVAVVGDAAAGAAEREARPQDAREADARRCSARSALHRERLVERVRDARLGRRRRPMPVIASLNLCRSSAFSIAFVVGADHLDAVLLQHAVLVQVQRAVERRLAAQRRQERVGPLLGDDLLDDLPGDRLDVGAVGRSPGRS